MKHAGPVLLARSPQEYLGADPIIESTAPEIVRLSGRLCAESPDDTDVARVCFEWVRDRIAHSWDAQDPRVTLTATQVLRERVGLCFAKSHLLVALLRSQQVPAGLCYQRLRDGEGFVLHGLVAVRFDDAWHRLDPRGNTAGVNAQFAVARELLAWRVDPRAGEVDYPRVYAEPAAVVVTALSRADDALALCAGGLPGHL